MCTFLTKHKSSQRFPVTLLTACLSQARARLSNAPVQLLLGDIYMQRSPCQRTTSPHPSPPQRHRTARGKGHPNSRDICFHNTKLLRWKIFPLVPSMSNCGRLPIEQTTLKQSSSSSPRRPRGGSPSPGAASHRTESAPLRLGEAVGRAGWLCFSSSPFRNLF